MFYESRKFSLPKDLLRAQENQDAFELDMERGVAAIADGVSTGLFAGNWARILSKAAVAHPPQANNSSAIADWLSGLQRQWRESIDVGTLAWHQKAKLKSGAFSTLLWVRVAEASAGNLRWRSYAVGDSCLFHLHGAKLLRAFPISESRLFDEVPHALGSIEQGAEHCAEFETCEGKCETGDLLALCTDALAAWALGREEAGEPVDWESWWDMPWDDWREMICQLRERREIRYDDTTLVLLRL
jgi:hypothetical protein